MQDLDRENRKAPLTSKGGDTEWVYWDAGTAHLLPRLLRLPDGHPDGPARTRGPLFLAEQKVPLQLIMAKTRHRNPRTAMR